MSILRIDYIEFPVTSIPAAKTFYGTAFGWAFEDWGDDYASFNDGRLNGGFRLVDSAEPGGTCVILFSKDLEKALKRVLLAGGTITKPIFQFPGGRRFEFIDPDGHPLAVWSDAGIDAPPA
jgi:uncharacterized protein